MEILGTWSVSSTVESLVDQAGEGFYIVTPCFRPRDRISRANEGARARGVEVKLPLRDREDRSMGEERAVEHRTHGVKVAFLSGLHANVYAAENEVIVRSMNLYDDSTGDSFEVAVRFTKAADADAYRQVLQHVGELATKADEEAKVTARERAVVAMPMAATHARVHRAARPHALEGDVRPVLDAHRLQPRQAAVRRLHKSSARFGNADFEKAYWHRCGKDAKASAAKPLCRPCWSVTL